jgi:hypothetical protein
MRQGLLAVAVAALMLPVGIYTGIIQADNGGNRDSGSHIDNVHNYKGAISDLRNFTLNTTLPGESPLMKIYKVIVPQYDRGWCEEQIRTFYPGWLDAGVEVKETKDPFVSTIFSTDTEVISVHSSGNLEYYNNTASIRWHPVLNEIMRIKRNQTGEPLPTVLSKDEAYQAAIRYIDLHGGFPPGYTNFHNSTIQTSNGKITVESGYLFRFARIFSGYPEVGPGAMIWITPLGDVVTYSRLWRDIGAVKGTVKIVTAQQALEYLDKNGFVYETEPIEKVELGYYSGYHEDILKELSPVWIFYTDQQHSQYRVVDAVGLTFGG